jgi:hypothetical protein
MQEKKPNMPLPRADNLRSVYEAGLQQADYVAAIKITQFVRGPVITISYRIFRALSGTFTLIVTRSAILRAPVPGMSWGSTILETLQGGIAGQLAVLDDASLTGTGESSAEILGVSVGTLSDKLTGHLVREIMVRGSHGGPLEPLAAQLNHDVTHLQGQRLEGLVGQLAREIRQAMARLDATQRGAVLLAQQARAGLALSSALEVRCSLPPDAAAFTGRDDRLDIGCAVPECYRLMIIGIVAPAPGSGRNYCPGGELSEQPWRP